MRYLLPLLLLPLCAVGQPAQHWAVSQLAAVSSAPNFEGLLPSGIRFRYKSSTLSGSPVSDWVDSVSSYHWTASGSARPTLDTNAVIFDGTANSLTATNGNINGAWLAVYQWVATTADRPIFCDLFGGGTLILAIGDTANRYYDTVQGNNGVGLVGTGLQDFISAQTASTPTFKVYTNGIDGQFSNGASYNGGVTLNHVGSGAGNFFAHVVLKEWIYWTNQGVWSATTISNVHCYATNTYPHTP